MRYAVMDLKSLPRVHEHARLDLSMWAVCGKIMFLVTAFVIYTAAWTTCAAQNVSDQSLFKVAKSYFHRITPIIQTFLPKHYLIITFYSKAGAVVWQKCHGGTKRMFSRHYRLGSWQDVLFFNLPKRYLSSKHQDWALLIFSRLRW